MKSLLARPFLRFGGAWKAVGRVPAYLYAAVTLVYAFMVIL